MCTCVNVYMCSCIHVQNRTPEQMSTYVRRKRKTNKAGRVLISTNVPIVDKVGEVLIVPIQVPRGDKGSCTTIGTCYSSAGFAGLRRF